MKFSSSLLLLLGWHAFTEVACETDVPALRRMMTNMRLVVLVSPCTVGPANRMLASEWLRVAFHDAGSHDAANGVGGIDGSFLYELDYEENNGVFGSATMQQYRTIQERTVSLADIIVLGAITAIGSCGGPVIPFLGGRIDAKGPVTPGFLPSPGQTLSTHQAQFARMGFSNKEMISLVACGHTIGGVHVANNPTITSEAMAGFDTTRAVFDNQGAIEYKNGILANPLAQPVNASNLATSSDSRIFSSDNNATINSYAASQDTFFNDCSTVFSKMFNELVPRGTSLTSIKPYPVSVGLVYSLRNEVFQIQIGNARVFDLAGEWSSYDIIYHNRDGSLGTNSELLRVRTMRTLSNGAPIQIKDFSTVAPGIDPITGISSVSVVLTLNDGTIYSSEDGAETVAIEDRIVIDLGIPFSCIYTSPAGDIGLNISIAVLGPFSADDKVYIDYELASDLSRTTFGEPIRANFRAARPGTDYNYYGVYVRSRTAINMGNFGARVVRANGDVQRDTRHGIFYFQSLLTNCIAGAVIPDDSTTTLISTVPSTVFETSTQTIATETSTPETVFTTTTLSVDGPVETNFTTVVIPASTETTYDDITNTAPVSHVTETFTPEPSRTTTFVTETSTSTEVLVQTSTSTVYVECTAGARVRRGRQSRRAYITLTETSGVTTFTSTVNVTEVGTVPTLTATITETESGPLTVVTETSTDQDPAITTTVTRYFDGTASTETSTVSLDLSSITETATTLITTGNIPVVTSTSIIYVTETLCSTVPITVTTTEYSDITTTPPVTTTTQIITAPGSLVTTTVRRTVVPDPRQVITTVIPRTTTVYTTKTSLIKPVPTTLTRTTVKTLTVTGHKTVYKTPARVTRTTTLTRTTGTTKCTGYNILFPSACCPTSGITLIKSPTPTPTAKKTRRAAADAIETVTETRFTEAPTPISTILTTVGGASSTSTLTVVTTLPRATTRATVTAATPRRTLTQTVTKTGARSTITKTVTRTTTKKSVGTRTSTLKAVTTTKTVTVRAVARCATQKTTGSSRATSCPKAGLAGSAGRKAQVASIKSLKKLAPPQTVTISCGSRGKFLY